MNHQKKAIKLLKEFEDKHYLHDKIRLERAKLDAIKALDLIFDALRESFASDNIVYDYMQVREVILNTSEMPG